MSMPVIDEPILEPERQIIDAHHHLWVQPEEALVATEARDTIMARGFAPIFRASARYLLDEFLADVQSGHNVMASVFVDAHTMHRAWGPELFRSVGQTEFVRGVAAMSGSGLFGKTQVCAAIAAGVDLTLGDAAEPVLEAHVGAGGGLVQSVRVFALYDGDAQIFGEGAVKAGVLLDEKFRQGLRLLPKFNLAFEALVLEPQLRDVIDLARAFPNIGIILNHIGIPIGIGEYRGRREERFPVWRKAIQELAACDNVTVKLGGLGMLFGGFPSFLSQPAAGSDQLAAEWKPYIDTCVEEFGAERCMFESNFPVDRGTAPYPVIWNAFKKAVRGASEDEKDALFFQTAARVYNIGSDRFAQ